MKVVFILVSILLSLFLYNEDNDIVVNNIDYYNYEIPSSFHGYKILQISDLHNKKFGINQKKLINYTKDIDPDIIVVTGDIIDNRRTNLNNMNITLSYLKEAVKIAPVYYVTGNHESGLEDIYKKFKSEMIKYGVIDLNDKSVLITRENQNINLIGLNDISFIKKNENRKVVFQNKLKKLKEKNYNNFTILLSHRPDLINIYEKEKIDLVLCGHAHGGQIRIPFVGGLYSPNQGIMPKYTSGKYVKNETSMIVSRGLGNSRFPFRIFNKPELVVITLKK